jgi:hypothetical protein
MTHDEEINGYKYLISTMRGAYVKEREYLKKMLAVADEAINANPPYLAAVKERLEHALDILSETKGVWVQPKPVDIDNEIKFTQPQLD